MNARIEEPFKFSCGTSSSDKISMHLGRVNLGSFPVVRLEGVLEKFKNNGKPSLSQTGVRSTITYKELEGLEEQQVTAIFGNQLKFVEANPGSIIFPSKFALVGEKIQNFKVRPDDLWILAFPRTGSNWLQEMVWLIGNDLNFEEAKKTQLCFRSVLLEGTAVSGHLYGEWGTKPDNTITFLENTKSPRHIKTHVPWIFLPNELDIQKPKILYVARNPKDTCLSLYMFLKLSIHMQMSLETFCELFIAGKVPYGNYFDHVLTYWNKRDQPNILFLKYEDMKKDIKGSILKVAEFLGKNVSEENVKELADHLSFQNMSKNRAVNREDIAEAFAGPDHKSILPHGFLRKGDIGDWRNHMSHETVMKFDAWAEQNLRGTGLYFE